MWHLQHPERNRTPRYQQGLDPCNNANDLVEAGIRHALEAHGPDSVGTYLGNPIVHNLGMLLFVKSLTGAIGSRNVFSATSMDQLPHHFAAHHMFGHEFRIPVPDIDRTDYMILMGANPMASNGSIMTSAGVQDRLRRIAGRGGKVVLIDPRRTETAKVVTEHYFIQPGTDVFFLLSFLHVLHRDAHLRTDRLGIASNGSGLPFVTVARLTDSYSFETIIWNEFWILEI